MREDTISFIEDGDSPFSIQMMGTSYCDGNYLIRRSESSIYCFEYILEGKGTVMHGSKVFYPSGGDIYILHKGIDHVYYSDKDSPWTKIWFNIYGPLVDALMAAYELQEVCHIQGLDVSPLFYKMLKCDSKIQNQKEVFHSASLIFHDLLQSIYCYVQPGQGTDLAGTIKDLIDRNIHNNVSLEHIAEMAFCSPAHAIRIFKEKYHMTPYEYMMDRKAAVAKQLLKNTSMSINEIACRLSFHDQHYFSAFFKRRTGISPLAFRRN